MKSNEFLEEVLHSDICPDNFEKRYSEFQTYQDLAWKVLQEFHRVCELTGIHYQVAFGTLLGVIRDNGQIPWDYDIDVIVPVQEREKLIISLEKHLNERFYFNTYEKNNGCSHVILRVAPIGYNSTFLHVDVFFMAGLPDDTVLEKHQRKLIKKTALMLKAKRYFHSVPPSDGFKEKCKMIVYFIMGLVLSESSLLKKYYKTTNLYPLDKTTKCCLADRFAEMYNLKWGSFKDTEIMITKFGPVRIPSAYDEILTEEYGDYNVYAPLESRIKEMMRHCYYLEHYGKIKTNE